MKGALYIGDPKEPIASICANQRPALPDAPRFAFRPPSTLISNERAIATSSIVVRHERHVLTQFVAKVNTTHELDGVAGA